MILFFPLKFLIESFNIYLYLFFIHFLWVLLTYPFKNFYQCYILICHLKHLKDIYCKIFIKYFYELTSYGVNLCSSLLSFVCFFIDVCIFLQAIKNFGLQTHFDWKGFFSSLLSPLPPPFLPM